MPRRTDVLAATPLSRRAVLCGALAAGLSGCARERTPEELETEFVGRVTGMPTTVTADDVTALFQRLDATLDARDWTGFAALVGAKSDLALWQRVFDGLHAVPMTERTVEFVGAEDFHVIRETGRVLTPVLGRLRHRIDGVDKVSALQDLRGFVSRDRPGAPLVLTRLDPTPTDRVDPWQVLSVAGTAGSRVVLQYRVEDEAAALAALPTLDRGVDRAYRSVPQHTCLGKQSLLWGWEGDTATQARKIYGGTAMISAVGVCYRVQAEGKGYAARILVMPQDDDEELEMTACHETVHALAGSWGNRLPDPHHSEGLAVWVEYGYLTGMKKYRWREVKQALDAAVATHLWTGRGFYDGDDVDLRYGVAGLYYAWLEHRLGRPRVWDIARAMHKSAGEGPLARALGLEEAREADEDFADWARAF